MVTERKWIQAATIAVDPDTGAILVTGIDGGGGNEVVGLKNAAGVRINPATSEGLAAVLAKLSADPATQTTLAAVLAKLSSDPATQTTLAAVLAALDALRGNGLTFARTLFAAASSPATIVTAATGKTARVHALALTVSAEASVTIQDSDGNVLAPLGTFAANGGSVIEGHAQREMVLAVAPVGKGLRLVASAGTITGYVLYSTE